MKFYFGILVEMSIRLVFFTPFAALLMILMGIIRVLNELKFHLTSLLFTIDKILPSKNFRIMDREYKEKQLKKMKGNWRL